MGCIYMYIYRYIYNIYPIYIHINTETVEASEEVKLQLKVSCLIRNHQVTAYIHIYRHIHIYDRVKEDLILERKKDLKR